MKKLNSLFCCFVCFLYSSQIQAEDIKTLKCFFNKPGISAEWTDKGDFKSEVSEFIWNNQYVKVVFDNIDNAKSTARIIGDNGGADVYVIETSQSLSFLEITLSGNQILTSIFINNPFKDGSFPVVMSRHVSIINPIVSQYYGTCVNQTIN